MKSCWPVWWRGLDAGEKGQDYVFADTAGGARETFEEAHPTRVILSVGSPEAMKPVKQSE